MDLRFICVVITITHVHFSESRTEKPELEASTPTAPSALEKKDYIIGTVVCLVVGLFIVFLAVLVKNSYIRMKRNANNEHSIQELGRTDLGDVHVYDEISNIEKSAYAASSPRLTFTI
ncbi:uncharacterized protein LOC127842595 [Dreissena polymorpha]|uniref:Uncharacterized protein n=1 Tax=Dreissena polymorpha TaxID=45954 RepID=A0A9D4IVG4_DREPO|nr:uncharacterized protein LOC127842595 [Dreissena polymorpha]KAH3785658.1 hypothetical protein DPMN_163752 [Dreissena polymorpha]